MVPSWWAIVTVTMGCRALGGRFNFGLSRVTAVRAKPKGKEHAGNSIQPNHVFRARLSFGALKLIRQELANKAPNRTRNKRRAG
jgi:hypothetical protein